MSKVQTVLVVIVASVPRHAVRVVNVPLFYLNSIRYLEMVSPFIAGAVQSTVMEVLDEIAVDRTVTWSGTSFVVIVRSLETVPNP